MVISRFGPRLHTVVRPRRGVELPPLGGGSSFAYPTSGSLPLQAEDHLRLFRFTLTRDTLPLLAKINLQHLQFYLTFEQNSHILLLTANPIARLPADNSFYIFGGIKIMCFPNVKLFFFTNCLCNLLFNFIIASLPSLFTTTS
jgi:hypothetical protein